MKKLLFAILGGILGIPLSYYFQPEIVRAKTGSIGGYLENFGDILENSDLVGNVLLSVVVPDPYYLDKKVKLVELFSYHKLGLTNKYTYLFGDS